MFCSKCGKQLPDHARFCSGCGVAIATDAHVTPQAAPEPQAASEPQATPASETVASAPAAHTHTDALQPTDDEPTNLFIYGIISLCGALPYISVLGVIMGYLTATKTAAYAAEHGPLTGKLKLANLFSKIGLYAGLVMCGAAGIGCLLASVIS